MITRSVCDGTVFACRVSSKHLFDFGILFLRSILLTYDVDALLKG